MDFNAAMEILEGPPMVRTVAEAAGIHPDTVSRGRMVGDNRRSPPKEWKAIVRRLALERAAALSSLASELADA
jgi:hypothetical protein